MMKNKENNEIIEKVLKDINYRCDDDESETYGNYQLTEILQKALSIKDKQIQLCENKIEIENKKINDLDEFYTRQLAEKDKQIQECEKKLKEVENLGQVYDDEYGNGSWITFNVEDWEKFKKTFKEVLGDVDNHSPQIAVAQNVRYQRDSGCEKKSISSADTNNHSQTSQRDGSKTFDKKEISKEEIFHFSSSGSDTNNQGDKK